MLKNLARIINFDPEHLSIAEIKDIIDHFNAALSVGVLKLEQKEQLIKDYEQLFNQSRLQDKDLSSSILNSAHHLAEEIKTDSTFAQEWLEDFNQIYKFDFESKQISLATVESDLEDDQESEDYEFEDFGDSKTDSEEDLKFANYFKKFEVSENDLNDFVLLAEEKIKKEDNSTSRYGMFPLNHHKEDNAYNIGNDNNSDNNQDSQTTHSK